MGPIHVGIGTPSPLPHGAKRDLKTKQRSQGGKEEKTEGRAPTPRKPGRPQSLLVFAAYPPKDHR